MTYNQESNDFPLYSQEDNDTPEILPEQRIVNCPHPPNAWKETYYGDECALCGLFVPSGCGWWLPTEEEEEDYHSYDCTCENCLQDHPERDILYGDGTYFNYPSDNIENDCN